MNHPQYILQPVNPFFIAFSLVMAFLLNLLPWEVQLAFPTLLLWSWCFEVHQPRKVGIGIAFAMGLLMDVHDAVYLGENAFSLHPAFSYFAISIHRRVLWFPPLVQSFQVFPLFLGVLVVKLAVRLLISSDSHFPGWLYFGMRSDHRVVADFHMAVIGAAATSRR